MQGNMEDIDFAMRAICEYFDAHPTGSQISAEYLYYRGFPKEKDADALLRKLEAMNLVEYKSRYVHEEKTITLTDKGRIYFIEQEKEEKRKIQEKEAEELRQKRQFAHDWKIAIFSALAGAFLSEPLWTLIRSIIRLFSERSLCILHS